MILFCFWSSPRKGLCVWIDYEVVCDFLFMVNYRLFRPFLSASLESSFFDRFDLWVKQRSLGKDHIIVDGEDRQMNERRNLFVGAAEDLRNPARVIRGILPQAAQEKALPFLRIRATHIR